MIMPIEPIFFIVMGNPLMIAFSEVFRYIRLVSSTIRMCNIQPTFTQQIFMVVWEVRTVINAKSFTPIIILCLATIL